MTTRPPAVAGRFYPADPDELRARVDRYLAEAEPCSTTSPKAIVGPHAGYVYSGPVAGSAFRPLREMADTVERVVLVGPSHFVPVDGVAVSAHSVFQTPLGEVPVDGTAIEQLLEFDFVDVHEPAHEREHALETHIPFLQQTISSTFRIVPLVFGRCSAEDAATVLETVWGGDETIICVSSDLSHYHDYDSATRIDAETSEAIDRLEYEVIETRRACGAMPLRGLLYAGRQRSMSCEVVDVRNSGDTAGPRDQVVGYGAYVFDE